MGMIRKTITLPQGLDDWIKTRIADGDYGNDSEYLRDLVRRDRERREQAEAELSRLLDEAEASGISPQSFDEIWDEAEAEYRAKNG